MRYRATRELTRADLIWFAGVIVAVTIVGSLLFDSESRWRRAGVGFVLGLFAVAIPFAQRQVRIRRNRRLER